MPVRTGQNLTLFANEFLKTNDRQSYTMLCPIACVEEMSEP
jgi:hypothetical protein